MLEKAQLEKVIFDYKVCVFDKTLGFAEWFCFQIWF